MIRRVASGVGSKKKFDAAYELKETLGKGTFATVKLGQSKIDGNKVAVKIIDKGNMSGGKSSSNSEDSSDMEAIINEIKILKSVKHENVIGLKEIYESSSKLYLVMELVSGGELFDRIVEEGSYSEGVASNVVKDIAEAIRYLHKKGIVHRDLKPENLLYASPDPSSKIKIADFGLSKLIEPKKMAQTLMQTACGTPGYVAPEVLECQGYSAAVDLWSIGVISYILLCGFPPFYDENTANLFAQIMKGSFTFPSPWWDDISDSAKDFIAKLLVVDPVKRMPIDKLLEHPWITANEDRPLPLVQDSMRKWNAKRRFKGVVHAVIGLNRMKSAFGTDSSSTTSSLNPGTSSSSSSSPSPTTTTGAPRPISITSTSSAVALLLDEPEELTATNSTMTTMTSSEPEPVKIQSLPDPIPSVEPTFNNTTAKIMPKQDLAAIPKRSSTLKSVSSSNDQVLVSSSISSSSSSASITSGKSSVTTQASKVIEKSKAGKRASVSSSNSKTSGSKKSTTKSKIKGKSTKNLKSTAKKSTTKKTATSSSKTGTSKKTTTSGKTKKTGTTGGKGKAKSKKSTSAA